MKKLFVEQFDLSKTFLTKYLTNFTHNFNSIEAGANERSNQENISMQSNSSAAGSDSGYNKCVRA